VGELLDFGLNLMIMVVQKLQATLMRLLPWNLVRTNRHEKEKKERKCFPVGEWSVRQMDWLV
jgi:hypothetical protein